MADNDNDANNETPTTTTVHIRLDQEDNNNIDSTTTITGSDSEGRRYSSIEEMWTAQGIPAGASRQHTQKVWYDKAAAFYETHCPPTVDGVLGGFASISQLDLQGSRHFVRQLQKEVRPSLDFTKGAAAECGAGIGRVTKGLLLSLGVTHCDLVESSEKLLYEAPDYIGDHQASKCRFYHSGLQDWEPPPRRYSIIWIQWVLCYLTDDDIVAFLKRCAQGLLSNGGGGGGGVIVLKENTCGDDQTFVVDTEDASVCRSFPYWLKLVEAAGLRVILQTIQTDFPDDLFPVPMLALEPAVR